jgi:hypothetical protein
MWQMRRYAFIVRVVRCRIHKVCIIYVQGVIYILANIYKKNRKHTIQRLRKLATVSDWWKTGNTDAKRPAFEGHSSSVAEYTSAKRSAITSPQRQHAKKETFCDSWMVHRDQTWHRIWHTTVNITNYRLRIITETNETDRSHSISITRPNIDWIKSSVAPSLIHHKVLSRWSARRSKLLSASIARRIPKTVFTHWTEICYIPRLSLQGL